MFATVTHPRARPVYTLSQYIQLAAVGFAPSAHPVCHKSAFRILLLCRKANGKLADNLRRWQYGRELVPHHIPTSGTIGSGFSGSLSFCNSTNLDVVQIPEVTPEWFGFSITAHFSMNLRLLYHYDRAK